MSLCKVWKGLTVIDCCHQRSPNSKDIHDEAHMKGLERINVCFVTGRARYRPNERNKKVGIARLIEANGSWLQRQVRLGLEKEKKEACQKRLVSLRVVAFNNFRNGDWIDTKESANLDWLVTVRSLCVAFWGWLQRNECERNEKPWWIDNGWRGICWTERAVSMETVWKRIHGWNNWKLSMVCVLEDVGNSGCNISIGKCSRQCLVTVSGFFVKWRVL